MNLLRDLLTALTRVRTPAPAGGWPAARPQHPGPHGADDMTGLDELLAVLRVEGERLRAAVARASEAQWRTATAAPGWDVAAHIAHLAWTEEAALCAVRASRGDGGDWEVLVRRAQRHPQRFVDDEAVKAASEPTPAIIKRWDTARGRLPEELRSATGKLPWFGPPMSPSSMVTARLMETWAHGLDVYQALGVEPDVTDSIRHICHLGVRTRDVAYLVHRLSPPAEEFRLELTAPSGATWAWGPVDSSQRITGPAFDFARVVTQRIHRDDTALRAVGSDAEVWLAIAQAFTGPPGEGRRPLATAPGKPAAPLRER